jgi:ATP/maltotriose-dependent transcriptional regulator MalT
LAAIDVASIETTLLAARKSLQPEALIGAITKLRQSDGVYDLFGIALTNMARCLHARDADSVFQWLDEMDLEFSDRGITHVLGILRAIRAFYAAISGRFDEAEKALPPSEFGEGGNSAPIFWRERHLEGMARSMIASHGGDHDKAMSIADLLVAECERDGRRVALVEACLNAAQVLSQTSNQSNEALNMQVLGLETAEELHAPGVLDEWRPLLECHADDLTARLRPSTAQLLEGLLREWRGQVRPDLLSDREVSVLTCVANGLTNKHAARELMIGVDAVKFHLKRIFQKLQVHGRKEAVMRARAVGLI